MYRTETLFQFNILLLKTMFCNVGNIFDGERQDTGGISVVTYTVIWTISQLYHTKIFALNTDLGINKWRLPFLNSGCLD